MVCCVTGHRPSGFCFPREETDPHFLDYNVKLTDAVEELILSGCDTFITGMADGGDLDFANSVIRFRNVYEHISLEAAIPCPIKKTKKYTDYHQNRDYVLSQCDKSYIVSEYFHRGCMEKRNRFMVDRADIVFAIWNGKQVGGTWNTIRYARAKGKQIRYFMLTDLL